MGAQHCSVEPFLPVPDTKTVCLGLLAGLVLFRTLTSQNSWSNVYLFQSGKILIRSILQSCPSFPLKSQPYPPPVWYFSTVNVFVLVNTVYGTVLVRGRMKCLTVKMQISTPDVSHVCCCSSMCGVSRYIFQVIKQFSEVSTARTAKQTSKTCSAQKTGPASVEKHFQDEISTSWSDNAVLGKSLPRNGTFLKKWTPTHTVATYGAIKSVYVDIKNMLEISL